MGGSPWASLTARPISSIVVVIPMQASISPMTSAPDMSSGGYVCKRVDLDLCGRVMGVVQ